MFKQTLQTALERSWQRPNALTLLLWPLSLVYGLLIAVRRTLYRWGVFKVYRARIPVIVVGNVTVGGTGKTPLVIHLVNSLKQAGYQPAVVSRGYGGQATDWPVLVTPNTAPSESGDEPALIAARTGVPVAAGANRRDSIEALCKHAKVDVIISDDGLQHLALARDIEVCVVAARDNNTHLLPAGPYREPSARAELADFVVTSECANKEEKGAEEGVHKRLTSSGCAYAMSLSPRAPIAVSKYSKISFDATQGIHAVAGIGSPERFFQTCEVQGWQIERHVFPDHHQFCARDIEFNDDKPVLMTEKDAIKCRKFAHDRHWALPVDAKLEPDLIHSLLQQLQTHD